MLAIIDIGNSTAGNITRIWKKDFLIFVENQSVYKMVIVLPEIISSVQYSPKTLQVYPNVRQ